MCLNAPQTLYQNNLFSWPCDPTESIYRDYFDDMFALAATVLTTPQTDQAYWLICSKAMAE